MNKVEWPDEGRRELVDAIPYQSDLTSPRQSKNDLFQINRDGTFERQSK